MAPVALQSVVSGRVMLMVPLLVRGFTVMVQVLVAALAPCGLRVLDVPAV